MMKYIYVYILEHGFHLKSVKLIFILMVAYVKNSPGTEKLTTA